MPTAIHSSLRRVLSICHDPHTENFIWQAMQVSHEAATSSHHEATKFVSPTTGDQNHSSFGLVRVQDWDAAYEEIRDAKQLGRPYCLILVEARRDSWDGVREQIEKIWWLDETLLCIVCWPSDEGVWKISPRPSRSSQWAMFRMSGEPEDLFQLALCLSALSASTSMVSDTSMLASTNSQLDPVPQSSDNPSIAEQQAELALARDELATSKVYVNNVIRSMADSLLVIDANLTIGSVNPSLLDLLGYDEEALVGQSPGLIFGEEFAQGSIIENLLLQGSVSGVESSFLTSEGQVIPISVSGSMIQDEHGQFQGLVCVAQDITQRRRMEEEKLELHEKLLDTSRQLGMAEVASDVLHNVGNVLNSINVSIGVVTDLVKNSIVGDVGRISQLFHKHRDDLGSYLSTNPKGKQVPAYLEKLASQLVEEQQAAIVELNRLRENAQHAQHCVASNQDLAKAPDITEPISVVEILEEALTENHEIIESLKITVDKDFQEIPLLIVDKYKVLEILIDMIRNACQAMTKVSLKQLTVRAKLVPGPPDSLCLEVVDSGVGIDSEDLTKIFRQRNNANDGQGGMSLHNGALMAKNLGGALKAHSEGLGHGATFSLELPGNFHFPDL